MRTARELRWLILTYSLPAEPSAKRVFIWRKLKRLWAVHVNRSVWLLPATARNREELQWLASEIAELGGEAFVWEGASLLTGQDSRLTGSVKARVEREFSEILDAAERLHGKIATGPAAVALPAQEEKAASDGAGLSTGRPGEEPPAASLPELSSLIRRFRLASTRDWFSSPLREKTRARLAALRASRSRRPWSARRNEE